MKKIIFTILAVVLICFATLTGCGNYRLFDTSFKYDKAIVNWMGEERIIEIDSWTDYEGEQIQIWDKQGNVWLLNSVYTMLVKEEE